MMFNEVPFLDRFGAAAEAGFQGVEFLFPYEYPVEALVERLGRHRLENVLFNLPPGNWSGGERGLTCLPGRRDEFRAGVETALAYANGLGTKRVHAMAGIAPAGANPAELREAYVANLKYAASECARHGITLVIEAINTRDMPGFYLNTQQQAYEVLQEVNAPNLKMQMDCYHMQIMEGDLATKLRKYAPDCAHIQVAGVPERHEPDTGEVRYGYLFDLLDNIGYDGWVGCEYRPAANTADGLGWFRALSSQHAAV
jgi:hydroxypyruvate isomerase